MFNFKRSLGYSLLVFSSLSSCNVIERISENQESINLRKEGYNPYHVKGCGPKTLKKVLEKFGIKKEEKELSKEILDSNISGNILRDSLSIINNNAMIITWPWEMEESLKKYLKNYYEIFKQEGSQEKLLDNLEKIIKDQDNAVVLIKVKGSIGSYHWIPSFDNPKDFYDKNTRICLLYLLKKK
ncbi:MAG: hypothetical protein Q7S27_03810 [Nanoarchaeota archaeon]|nr:hypothetical protein [Nanoarchaeota archaeon]